MCWLTSEYHDDDASQPAKLRGLKQACYILSRLEEGRSKDYIASCFAGDRQLVDMWISFMLHNGWVDKDGGTWVVTEKGRAYINRYESKI